MAWCVRRLWLVLLTCCFVVAGLELATAKSIPRRAPRQPGSIQIGMASYYRYGTKTASGERFQPNSLTAAHRTLNFGTRVRVTRLRGGRSVVVRINDRGPFSRNRIIDVSWGAAVVLGLERVGTANVEVLVIPPRDEPKF